MLLLRRTLAFVVDAFIIGTLVTAIFGLVAMWWHFIHVPFDEGQIYGHAYRRLQNYLTYTAIAVCFAARDCLGPRAGLAIFRLRIFFAAKTKVGCLTWALARAAIFFLLPLFLMPMVFNLIWALIGQNDGASLRASIWGLLFCVLLVPLSIAFGSGRGLHDVLTSTEITTTPATSRKAAHPRRLLAEVFLSVAIAGIVALALELMAPKANARFAEMIRDFRAMSTAMQFRERGEDITGVIDLRNLAVPTFTSTDVDRMLSSEVPLQVRDRIASRLVEWKVAAKRNQSGIQLRDGVRVPVGAPYLHITILVKRAVMDDPFLATETMYAAGRSLLEANAGFSMARVSLVRFTRLGPQQVESQIDAWVVSSMPYSGRFEMVPPLSDARQSALLWSVGFGEWQLNPLFLINN